MMVPKRCSGVGRPGQGLGLLPASGRGMRERPRVPASPLLPLRAEGLPAPECSCGSRLWEVRLSAAPNRG